MRVKDRPEIEVVRRVRMHPVTMDEVKVRVVQNIAPHVVEVVDYVGPAEAVLSYFFDTPPIEFVPPRLIEAKAA